MRDQKNNRCVDHNNNAGNPNRAVRITPPSRAVRITTGFIFYTLCFRVSLIRCATNSHTDSSSESDTHSNTNTNIIEDYSENYSNNHTKC